MLIFIDTEFTDFVDAELISIGLITENGQHEFYAELPVNLRKCNDFVLENVLPHLGKAPGAKCTAEELELRLRAWLSQFRHHDEVIICFDFNGDWQLFQYALSNMVPDWLTCQNIYRDIDQTALERFFVETKLQDHHALNDAKANRYAYGVENRKVEEGFAEKAAAFSCCPQK